MADVLSQSQIDELLKSMQGGGGSAKAEEKPAPTEQTKTGVACCGSRKISEAAKA